MSENKFDISKFCNFNGYTYQIINSLAGREGNKSNNGFCLTLSKLQTDVLIKLGYNAKLCFISGIIENESAKQYRLINNIKDYSSISSDNVDEYIRMGGYSLGFGIGVDNNGIPNFHCVTCVEMADGRKYILDGLMATFSRPNHNILMGNFCGSIEKYSLLFADLFDIYTADITPLLERINPLFERKKKEFTMIKNEVFVKYKDIL